MNQRQELKVGRIIKGNCVDVMRAEFPDGCIPLTVTSPPYDALDEEWRPVKQTRDYKGYEFNFPEIARELWRVTAPGGMVCWNVDKVSIDGDEDDTPERQMQFFRKLGFKRYRTIIYSKDGRYTQTLKIGNEKIPVNYRHAWEYVYCFFKPVGGSVRPAYFNILKDHLNISFHVHKWRRNHASNRAKDGTVTKKNYNVHPWNIREDIWYYQNGYLKSTLDREAFGHGAVMPDGLAVDLIRSWSKENDIVFDPMAGTGTVLKAALMCNRRWVGCETAQEYIDIARRRIAKVVDPDEYFQTGAGTIDSFLQ